MQKEPKFKIGNIVRHKATQRHSSRKMLIMAVYKLNFKSIII